MPDNISYNLKEYNIPFSELKNFEVVGNGCSGDVYSVDYLEKKYVLKQPKNEEIKHFLTVRNHPNFVKFAGYTKEALCWQVAMENYREEPVSGTPTLYITLYTNCWDFDPEKRPGADEALQKIELLKNEKIEFIESMVHSRKNE
ncbi:2206_t:CDS:2 [Gigaspora margarita]|uniref:2206_t:CDS:1 n=1 Tax=Gigaspora margarita TaxID=4874 RepID=A0ABM8W2U3_GIGMA|nr:2206_t:CDS:2 [Gigaspora margarita]